MKTSILCLWLLVSFTVSAAEKNPNIDRSKPAKAAINEKESGTHTKNSKINANWPPRFNPSEKINADSMVSFPTDI